jgi:hypothetical protein
MGPRGQVAPIHHLIVTAGGWGANPDKDARYASITPEKNDGTTIYKLNVPANVPEPSPLQSVIDQKPAEERVQGLLDQQHKSEEGVRWFGQHLRWQNFQLPADGWVGGLAGKSIRAPDRACASRQHLA